MFSCNLPPALLAEWSGSFTCFCSNTGVERIPKWVSTDSWPRKRKFSCPPAGIWTCSLSVTNTSLALQLLSYSHSCFPLVPRYIWNWTLRCLRVSNGWGQGRSLSCEAHYSTWGSLGWVLLYAHRNYRLIRDRSPGRPPRLSHRSWALLGLRAGLYRAFSQAFELTTMTSIQAKIVCFLWLQLVSLAVSECASLHIVKFLLWSPQVFHSIAKD